MSGDDIHSWREPRYKTQHETYSRFIAFSKMAAVAVAVLLIALGVYFYGSA